MENSACQVLLQYQPSSSEVEELFTTYIICSVINAFSSYTTILLNSLTIHAMRKSMLMPKPLMTLLLSLAVSDLGVGLLVQPFAIELLVKWLQTDNPTCTTYTAFTIIITLFSFASFFSITLISADRFLAIHLHLRYQELVTLNRVVIATISIWIFSVFLSLIMLWIPATVTYVIFAIIEVICLVTTTFFNHKIYLAVRRHNNQIQALQVEEAAENSETGANVTRLRKTALGTFYVYLLFMVCYLPNISSYVLISVFGSGTAIKGLSMYTLTLVFLNSSLNPLIYCWKMRHIRHAVVNILRNTLTKLSCC